MLRLKCTCSNNNFLCEILPMDMDTSWARLVIACMRLLDVRVSEEGQLIAVTLQISFPLAPFLSGSREVPISRKLLN